MSIDRPTPVEALSYWLLLAAVVVGIVLFGLDRAGYFGPAGAAGEVPQLDDASRAELAVLEEVRELLEASGTVAELTQDAERRARASELLDGVLRRSPDLAEAHVLRGQELLSRGEVDAAVASVERSLELAPEGLEALLTLGAVHFGEQRLAEAETVFRRVVELYPDEPAGYHNLGQTVWSLGREDEATEIYRQKLEAQRRLDQAAAEARAAEPGASSQAGN